MGSWEWKSREEPEYLRWYNVMCQRIIAGFLSCRDMGELKGNLERLYTIRNRRFEILSILKKLYKLYRGGIRYLQEDYIRYCGRKGIVRVDFAVKKVLTLNSFELEVLIKSENTLGLRKLLLDYFRCNFYSPTQKRPQSYTKYRVNYMTYIVNGIKEFLETKKQVKFVMQESEEEKYLQYELDGLQQRYYPSVYQANSYFKQLKTNKLKFE